MSIFTRQSFSLHKFRAMWQAPIFFARELWRLNSMFKCMSCDGFTYKLHLFGIRYAAYVYALPIAFHYRHYLRLSRFLHQPERPALSEVDAANPLILIKMFYPYRRAGLSVGQRVDLLIEHYSLAESLFSLHLFRAVQINPQGFMLCQIQLPEDRGLLLVRLMRYPRMWREGEVSIGLYGSSGALLYTLTFSFCRDGSTQGIFIGSLIGHGSPDIIKNLTKLMYGLRPQGLMLFLTQALCRRLSFGLLQAIGREAHVFSGSKRAERLRFDYDAFWREQGGHALAHDSSIYRLPIHPERRPEATIPSQKRAQYRRRYTFLDGIENDLRARLDVGLAGLSKH